MIIKLADSLLARRQASLQMQLLLTTWQVVKWDDTAEPSRSARVSRMAGPYHSGRESKDSSYSNVSWERIRNARRIARVRHVASAWVNENLLPGKLHLEVTQSQAHSYRLSLFSHNNILQASEFIPEQDACCYLLHMKVRLLDCWERWQVALSIVGQFMLGIERLLIVRL